MSCQRQITSRNMEEKVETRKENQPSSLWKSGECYLPQHILEDTLLRLPPKSLVRFRSVCRRWYDVMSTVDFSKLFFRRRISNIRIAYQDLHMGETLCSYKLDEKGMKASKVASLPFKRRMEYSYYADAVTLFNNLVLFQEVYKEDSVYERRVYVYDIINHKQRLLPRIARSDELVDCSLVCDASSSHKYKVVVFPALRQHGVKLFYIYSLNLRKWSKNEKWRKLEPPFPMCIDQYSLMALDGVLYWIGRKDGGIYAPDNPENFIRRIDVAKEKFMEAIKPPTHTGFGSPSKYDLLEMKGVVCLFGTWSLKNEFDIWVLKDSVKSIWNKHITISLSCMMNNLVNFKYPLFFQAKLIVENYIMAAIEGELYWYKMDTKELRHIEVESARPFPTLRSVSVISN